MTDTKHSLCIHHPSLIVNALIPLTLPQHIAVLFQWAADKLGLLPQVWCEETVCVRDGGEGGLEGILKGLGATSRRTVGIVDTSQL